MRYVNLPSTSATLAILCFALLSSACSPLKPWLKPYERENLADPIMSFDRDQVDSGYLNHVLDARESARGAEGASGGGCGCN